MKKVEDDSVVFNLAVPESCFALAPAQLPLLSQLFLLCPGCGTKIRRMEGFFFGPKTDFTLSSISCRRL
jgi:hypothetical protein